MALTASSFAGACDLVEHALTGGVRAEIVGMACRSGSLREALLKLRSGLRSNAWSASSGRAPLVDLAAIVNAYDRMTREEGFHALHDWDGKADKVNEDIIPVDVLDYIARQRSDDPPDPIVLAILCDYYFLHVLSLMSLRVWDDGDPNENLDRLEALRSALEGEQGSGQRFVDDAETLVLLATSHYELAERGFRALLEKVRALDHSHQLRVALGHANSLGSHLRFGFEATCGRDTLAMRDDNVADYPWLCFSLATLMKEYARSREDGADAVARDHLVGALLNGLTPDARAFVGDAPSSLSRSVEDRMLFRALFDQHREELVAEFARYRPSSAAYSPLSFYFNFAHNVLKGTVVDALLWGRPWRVSFNDLLTDERPQPPDAATESRPSGLAASTQRHRLAVTLMGHARSHPDTIRGRLMPVIVYDPDAGRQAFSITMRKLAEPARP